MSQPELVELKDSVYKDPRPKEHFDRYHERTRTHRPNFMYEVVRILTSLVAWIFFRARNVHPEKVPAVGPVILAPNHFSFLDHFFLAVPLRRKVHFMAKSQLFKPPMEKVYSPGGDFPVRRGFADEEAFTDGMTSAAWVGAAVLGAGALIALLVPGKRPRQAAAQVAEPAAVALS